MSSDRSSRRYSVSYFGGCSVAVEAALDDVRHMNQSAKLAAAARRPDAGGALARRADNIGADRRELGMPAGYPDEPAYRTWLKKSS